VFSQSAIVESPVSKAVMDTATEQVNVLTSVVTAALAPLLAPGTDTPIDSPLMWAVVGWVRRVKETLLKHPLPVRAG
jgi:hypothetical protein